jgi:hypothetical protein
MNAPGGPEWGQKVTRHDVRDAGRSAHNPEVGGSNRTRDHTPGYHRTGTPGRLLIYCSRHRFDGRAVPKVKTRLSYEVISQVDDAGQLRSTQMFSGRTQRTLR